MAAWDEMRRKHKNIQLLQITPRMIHNSITMLNNFLCLANMFNIMMVNNCLLDQCGEDSASRHVPGVSLQNSSCKGYDVLQSV